MEEVAIYVMRSSMTDLVRVAIYNKKERKLAEDILGSDISVHKLDIRNIPCEVASKIIHKVVYENKLDTKLYSCMSDPYATLYLNKQEYDSFVSSLETHLIYAVDEYNKIMQ